MADSVSADIMNPMTCVVCGLNMTETSWAALVK